MRNNLINTKLLGRGNRIRNEFPFPNSISISISFRKLLKKYFYASSNEKFSLFIFMIWQNTFSLSSVLVIFKDLFIFLGLIFVSSYSTTYFLGFISIIFLRRFFKYSCLKIKDLEIFSNRMKMSVFISRFLNWMVYKLLNLK